MTLAKFVGSVITKGRSSFREISREWSCSPKPIGHSLRKLDENTNITAPFSQTVFTSLSKKCRRQSALGSVLHCNLYYPSPFVVNYFLRMVNKHMTKLSLVATQVSNPWVFFFFIWTDIRIELGGGSRVSRMGDWHGMGKAIFRKHVIAHNIGLLEVMD